MVSPTLVKLAFVGLALSFVSVALLIIAKWYKDRNPPAPPPQPPVPPPQPPQPPQPPAPPPSGGGTMLDRGPINVRIQRGMGAGGRHALHKQWKGSPFPFRDGALVGFDVNFAPGYEWGCQGKLGGLFIGTGKASGGVYSSDGASHRIMWDRGGGAHAYVYIPKGTAGRQPSLLSRPGNYGQGVWKRDFAGVFKPGTWHRVELGVKLNTPGRSDGLLLMRIDGISRSLSGVYWRQGSEPITRFAFGVFHGGPCSAQANSSLQFRNVQVRRWTG
jgi:hypothetical protein